MARVSLLLALFHIYPNPLPACLHTYTRTRLSLSYPVPGTWVPPSAFSPRLDGASLGREHPTRQSRQAAFRRRWVNEGGRERKWGNPAHFFRSPAWHPEFERIPTCKRFEFFFSFFSFLVRRVAVQLRIRFFSLPEKAGIIRSFRHGVQAKAAIHITPTPRLGTWGRIVPFDSRRGGRLSMACCVRLGFASSRHLPCAR